MGSERVSSSFWPGVVPAGRSGQGGVENVKNAPSPSPSHKCLRALQETTRLSCIPAEVRQQEAKTTNGPSAPSSETE